MMIVGVNFLADFYLSGPIFAIILYRRLIFISLLVSICVLLSFEVGISFLALFIKILIELRFIHHEFFELLNVRRCRSGVHFASIRIRIVHASLLNV